MAGLVVALVAMAVAQGPQKNVSDKSSTGADAATAASASVQQDDKPIRLAAQAFAKAYNASDPKAIAQLFLPDGEIVSEDGQSTQGREKIEQAFAEIFKAHPKSHMEVATGSVRFIGPDLAIESGTATVTRGADEPVERSPYSVVYVKQDGKWLTASARDLPDEASTPEEQLKQLQWLIGDWVDESPKALVVTSYRWTDNHCYIVGEFKAKVGGRPLMIGTQRIGWDPLAKTIRSWVFDSEGGFGEGIWTQEGNRWIVEKTGVTREGKVAWATNIITHVSKDRMTWQQRDRIVGGEKSPERRANSDHAQSAPAHVTEVAERIPMNIRMKTVAGVALVVALSAGLALAGRGGGGGFHGGGGGGGGFHGGGGFQGGGGGGRAAAIHTPSFSTPRPNFNASRPAETPAFRPSTPANRPAVTPGNRPNAGQRPEFGENRNLENRFNAANRPGFENRPQVANRPNIDHNIVNRPNIDHNIVNRPNIGNNIGNRSNIGNNININRTNNLIRPTHNDWNRGDWYHGNWHGNWNNGWRYRPAGWWTAGFWAGAAVSAIPWSWGYWPYYNPYYAGPVVDNGVTINYSQPIVLAQPASGPPTDQAAQTAEQQATPLFDAARDAFMQADYKAALAEVDRAIALVPDDTVLHEFRALTLFAAGTTRKRPPPIMRCFRSAPVGTGRRSADSIPAWTFTRSNSGPWNST